MRTVLIATLMLAACEGTTLSVDTGPTPCLAEDAVVVYVDDDGDGFGRYETPTSVCAVPEGFSERGGDCDDARDDVFPEADELCDGIDNDCNTLIDDDAVDATTSYADYDEDGFGDPERAWNSCTPPDGFVQTDGDCNDARDDVYPGADELCDGLDNDCDDVLPTDELDADEDGVMVCDGDCDDERGDRHPGLPERCDGLDTNCDGRTDEAGAIDATAWHIDLDGDGYGGAPNLTACEGPEGWVDNALDCDDATWWLTTDCGTPACEVCPVGVDCDDGSTCESGVCDGTCQEPTCDDGVRNGVETDVDCGGDCAPCELMQTCAEASDCLSDTCIDAVCSCPDDAFCDDGNPCTDNVCSDDTHQCVTLNNNDTCSDGTNCTGGDQCVDGSCQATPVTCQDTNACTLDSCNDETGLCEFEPDPDFIEGDEYPGINPSNGCRTLGAPGEVGYDGTAVYMVFQWPGAPGEGAPSGWITVNHCAGSPFQTNSQFYWPSLLRKVCQ